MAEYLRALRSGPAGFIAYVFGPTLGSRIGTAVGLLVAVTLTVILLGDLQLMNPWAEWQPVSDPCALDDPRWCLE